MGEDADQALASFMMEQVASNEGSEDSSSQKNNDKGTSKDGEKKELTEEQKELQNAKKSSAAKAKAIGFNPELAKRQIGQMALVYGIIGMLIIGLLVYSKRHEGWISKGIGKAWNKMLFGHCLNGNDVFLENKLSREV
jgi:hypothetical protein